MVNDPVGTPPVKDPVAPPVTPSGKESLKLLVSVKVQVSGETGPEAPGEGGTKSNTIAACADDANAAAAAIAVNNVMCRVFIFLFCGFVWFGFSESWELDG